MTKIEERSYSPPLGEKREENTTVNEEFMNSGIEEEKTREEDDFVDEDLGEEEEGEEGGLLGSPPEVLTTITTTTTTTEGATWGDYVPSCLGRIGLQSVLSLPTSAAVLLLLATTEGISQSFMVPFTVYQIESFGIRLVVVGRLMVDG